MGIRRANPHLEEIIEVLDLHLQKYSGDQAKAREYLSKDDNAWIDSEILHCMTERRYFLSNYYAIKTEDRGFTGLYPFWDSQEILHDEFRRLEKQFGRVRAIVNKARQMGGSTYVSGEVFAATIFSEHVNSIVVAQDADVTRYILDMYAAALDFLPWWMRPRIRYQEAGKFIDFDEKDESLRLTRPGLKTRIYGDNGNKPTGVGRSKTFSRAHLDELPFWTDPSQLTKALFPTFNAPDGFYVMISTPKGRNNPWHNMWRKAEAGDIDWNPIYIPFYRREKTYSLPIPKGENFKLTKDEEDIKSLILKKDNHLIKDEVFNWRRKRIQEFIANDGDDKMFNQEYCLIGSTLISTSSGLVPIGELKDHTDMAAGGNAITNWLPQGTAKVYRAVTKLGYSVVGTFEHRVPTLDSGDIQLGELTGRTITLCPPEFGKGLQRIEWKEPFDISCSILVDEDIARFLGYFMGDGCYHHTSVIFACDKKDQDVVEDISRLMTKYFGTCHARQSGTKQGGVNLSVGCAEFAHTLKRMGIWQKEKPHRRVMVPEVIFRSPKHIIKEFLRGLFEADGFCGYEGSRVSLFAKGKEFLRNIQVLLLGFGITSRLVNQNKKNPRGGMFIGNALDLRAAEARRFCEEIGFIGERKRSRQRVVEKKIGRPQAKIEFRDEVISVTPEGEAEVFDITVANSHLFSANGILVHNSMTAEESFQTSAVTAYPLGIINRLMKRVRNPKWIGEINYDFDAGRPKVMVKEVDPAADLEYPKHHNRFSIWKRERSGAVYVVGVDVSLGNDGGDFSSIHVIDISPDLRKDEVVAVWHGYIDPESLAEVVLAVCWMYNEALAAVEVNSMGMVTNNKLVRQYEYENIYRYKHLDKLTRWMTDIIGFWTNDKTKRALMSKMSKVLIDDLLDIPDKFTIDEFYDFTEDGAEGDGARDDLMMSLHIALYCGHENEYREIREGTTKQESTKQQNEFVIRDRFGTMIHATNSQQEAERVSKKNIGSSIVRTAGATATVNLKGLGKRRVPADRQNTDYSPVFDGDGPAARMHEEGFEPEEITPELIQEWEAEQEAMEDDSDEAWKYA